MDATCKRQPAGHIPPAALQNDFADIKIVGKHAFECQRSPNDPIVPKIFIKIIMEIDEGETLYVSLLHFKSDEVSPNESRIIKQVQADDIEAMSDFLEGGMTAGQIVNALSPIGVFDFDPRETVRAENA